MPVLPPANVLPPADGLADPDLGPVPSPTPTPLQPLALQSLLRLMVWLSPAFPVGGFAYSTGLEKAGEDGLVGDVAGLRAWLEPLLTRGGLWNDAVLLAEAWRVCDRPDRLAAVASLAEALCGSHERHLESLSLGTAFVAAAAAWPSPVMAHLPRDPAYPVAVGALAGAHKVDLEAALAAYLQAALSQQVSAGIRLGLAGQRDGVALLAGLEPVIAATAMRAALSGLDDLGSATILAEIVAARHEAQATRLFRS